jgi:hypothetical protein
MPMLFNQQQALFFAQAVSELQSCSSNVSQHCFCTNLITSIANARKGYSVRQSMNQLIVTRLIKKTRRQ